MTLKFFDKVGSENYTEALQRDLHELHKQSEDWQMLLNAEK